MTTETWKVLFGHALTLIDDVLQHGTKDLYWTFGGGTVLMLRHNHRFSKDIDIFVPDPQALGFVTPRLSSHAETLTSDYTEAGNFVKLFLPEGEIDFVASPNLTDEPYVLQELLGRTVRVETSAEIRSYSLNLSDELPQLTTRIRMGAPPTTTSSARIADERH